MSATAGSDIFFETIEPETAAYARQAAHISQCVAAAWEAVANQDREMFHEALRNLTKFIPADHVLISELCEAHALTAKAALKAFTLVPSKPQYTLRQIAAISSTITSAMTPTRKK